jgi:Na+/pantothenate symporter
MQPFEFSNNAISLLLSVFSVIVGMTYPLLLQAIQRIDEQYRSSRITKMLKEEKVFRIFQWLVTISIAFAFISIFILQLLDDCPTLTIVWVTIHTLLTWLLLVTTILLVYTIMTYYNPDELLDRINNLRSHRRS